VSIPVAELQKLDPSAELSFIVLDCTVLGGSTYYLFPGVNGLGASVVWQGITYTPIPIEMEGFEWSSKGTLPRPKLRVAALDGLIGGLVHSLQDLVGAKVILKRTFAKYIDAANFSPAVNANADPTAGYADEPWIIERKTLETSDVIEFELITPLDAQNAMIPKRRITANVCPWTFKGTECGYVGATATCAKTLAACKTNFGATADLSFGAFPGVARVR
jgi:lambda family phage minor tail protein L